MDNQLACPVCHAEVKPTDYFCFNCGKNLHPPLLSTSISAQITLYLKSFFLPPLGIIWGARYLRQPDRKSKIVGLIAIISTIIIVVIVIQATFSFVNIFNQQLNGQLQNLQGL